MSETNVDQLAQLLIFCEGMRVGVDKSQSKTLDDLMNAAMAQSLGDKLEIKKLRKMLSDLDKHGILSVLDRFETNLAESNDKLKVVEEALTEFEDRFEYRFAKAREELENSLAWLYNQSAGDAVAVEKLCDERLDRSGAMLGRIRDTASAPAIIEREEAEGQK